MAITSLSQSKLAMTLLGLLALSAGHYQPAALSGNVTMDKSYPSIVILDPGGADRNVTLPAEADSKDNVRYIRNSSDGTGEDLAILDDAGATVTTLYRGDWVILICDGTTWNIAHGPENQQSQQPLRADPGTAAAIPVTRSATFALTTGASGETNTLAAPLFVGQLITLVLQVDGGGNRVVTSAVPINWTGNNTITLAEQHDCITLQGIYSAGALRWHVAANDGAALSTV